MGNVNVGNRTKSKQFGPICVRIYEQRLNKPGFRQPRLSNTKGGDRNLVNLGHSVLKASENFIQDGDTKLENTGSR